MPRVGRDDDEVRILAARGCTDFIARIWRPLHDEARRDTRARAPDALAKVFELLLFGVVVQRIAGGESQLLRRRDARHSDVKDQQLGVG